MDSESLRLEFGDLEKKTRILRVKHYEEEKKINEYLSFLRINEEIWRKRRIFLSNKKITLELRSTDGDKSFDPSAKIMNSSGTFFGVLTILWISSKESIIQ